MSWMWPMDFDDVENQAQPELGDLTAEQSIAGFTVHHLYVDDADHPLGGRFTHDHTGFVLQLLRIQTVPQAYLWVNTVPVGDRGEPHTQEHLLLGKGNRGRAVATLEDMSLVTSSAFTSQLRTVYHLHTTASPGVFFDVLDARLGALLFPDYTDEEIRREVHHYGVREAPAGGLALEEKGTIYNEMDSSFQGPGANLWRRVGQDLFGVDHPVAFSSGGLPDAIRSLTPEHIRRFHEATHHLANMGAIAVLPPDQPLVETLERLDGILRGHQPDPTPEGTAFSTEDTLPAPHTVDERELHTVAFPSGDPRAAGSVLLAWPPTRDLAPHEHTLLGVLLSGLAGNDSSTLYRAIVDSSTRERDTGARSVWASASDDLGFPVYFGVAGIPGSELDDDTARWLADRIQQELRDVAALAPDDPGLVDLKQRLRDEIVAFRRSIRRSISAPPGFGFRGTSSGWFSRLREIDAESGFRRSLTLTPHFDFIDAELAKPGNPYAEHLAGLVEQTPLVYVNRPDPVLLEALGEARAARLDDATGAIAERFGVDDPQEGLRRFKEAYDRDTARLEAAEQVVTARFVDDPPMDYDSALDFATGALEGVPTVRGRFDAMTGADVRLSLSLGDLTADQQRWIPVLATLLTRSGVVIDGSPVSYREVRSRLQREVLSAGAWLNTSARTGRLELALLASGTTPEEVDAAVGWAATFLDAPDWRPENLPRLRDLVESSLSRLQSRMLGREESWVRNPRSAMLYGDQPAQLRAWSFLTQAHDVQRLFWRLATPPSDATLHAVRALAPVGERLDREALRSLFRTLSTREGDVPEAVEDLVAPLLASEDEGTRTLAGHLERALADIPDSALGADLHYLVRRLAADWAEPPADALTELDSIRGAVRHRAGAHLVVSAGAMADDIDDRLRPLLALLDDGPPPGALPVTDHVVRRRLADRGGDPHAPNFGLFDPNRRSGVHLHAGPGPSIESPTEDAVLDHIAANTWGGGGAHGLFMATWGAGLAYSNGVSTNLDTARTHYYAERCPSLGQTMDFVIDELKNARVTPAIAEYAIAQGFSSRAASDYGSRTASMARDLLDDRGPERIRAFREAVLAQRDRPDLVDRLQERLLTVYAGTLPGLGDRPVLSLVIGDDRQLDEWAAWLETHDAGPLQRLYPRDFWIVEPD